MARVADRHLSERARFGPRARTLGALPGGRASGGLLELSRRHMPSFAITTFGCQMNVHDSERMHEVLARAGFVEVAEGEADVVVLNTCSVREKAEQKLRS